MKIGILTHHYVKNFGAYLQAYSLINTLKNKYPNAQIEIIDYRVGKHEYKNGIHYFGFKASRGDTLSGYFGRVGLFFTFLKYENSLKHSQRFKSSSEIDHNSYDLIIIGSDEVWNYNDIAYDPVKFGYGLNGNAITYAASAGNSKYNEDIDPKIIEGLNNLKAIAVRDDVTEQLAYELTHQKVNRVLDPVFLYEYKSECSKKVERIVSQKDYILIYDCVLNENQIKTLVKYANDNNLNILGAGEYRNWYSSTDTVNISPFEWIYLFEHAKTVLTGTFHGTSFAVKYNKPFAVYATFPNRISKVKSLLKMFDLESRIVTDPNTNLIGILENDIKYEKVNNVIADMKNQSLDYLFSKVNKYSA
ncbi:MAG: polysaccharide pyruvyl transferase family protein [Butyrivibrio sp.]|uniref:polysaccharide pyruvyl transferase family protein n=1 Tax=Butyrivibrio sp. TaxID=28121 RepID=UPI0025D681F1|nr:polysaccharide pyruvyl transferase family protein [Butyrivibrio sp.]MCR5770842.1 polysaccharide pyruvyl transferase family protein [Butyrivibrio sp.]